MTKFAKSEVIQVSMMWIHTNLNIYKILTDVNTDNSVAG